MATLMSARRAFAFGCFIGERDRVEPSAESENFSVAASDEPALHRRRCAVDRGPSGSFGSAARPASATATALAPAPWEDHCASQRRQAA